MRPLGWLTWFGIMAATLAAVVLAWPQVLIAAIGWCLLILIPLSLVTNRQKEYPLGWLPPLLATVLLGLAWTALTYISDPPGSEGVCLPPLLMLADIPSYHYLTEDQYDGAIRCQAVALGEVGLALLALIAAVVLNIAVRQFDLSRQERNDSQRQ